MGEKYTPSEARGREEESSNTRFDEELSIENLREMRENLSAKIEEVKKSKSLDLEKSLKDRESLLSKHKEVEDLLSEAVVTMNFFEEQNSLAETPDEKVDPKEYENLQNFINELHEKSREIQHKIDKISSSPAIEDKLYEEAKIEDDERKEDAETARFKNEVEQQADQLVENLIETTKNFELIKEELKQAQKSLEVVAEPLIESSINAYRKLSYKKAAVLNFDVHGFEAGVKLLKTNPLKTISSLENLKSKLGITQIAEKSVINQVLKASSFEKLQVMAAKYDSLIQERNDALKKLQSFREQYRDMQNKIDEYDMKLVSKIRHRMGQAIYIELDVKSPKNPQGKYPDVETATSASSEAKSLYKNWYSLLLSANQ